MNRFIEHIATVRLDDTYTRFLNTLSKTPLIVLDDFSLAQLDINMQLTLLQIMEDRYKKYPIMITFQIPVKEWHPYIGEQHLLMPSWTDCQLPTTDSILKENLSERNNPLSSTLLS